MTGDNTLIHSHGVNRRDFMKLCAALAATMGLSSKAAAEMAESFTNLRVRQLSGLARRVHRLYGISASQHIQR